MMREDLMSTIFLMAINSVMEINTLLMAKPGCMDNLSMGFHMNTHRLLPMPGPSTKVFRAAKLPMADLGLLSRRKANSRLVAIPLAVSQMFSAAHSQVLARVSQLLSS